MEYGSLYRLCFSLEQRLRTIESNNNGGGNSNILNNIDDDLNNLKIKSLILESCNKKLEETILDNVKTIDELNNRLTQLEAKPDLTDRLTQLEAKPDLTDRLTQLEAKPDLTDRLTKLEKKLDSLVSKLGV